MKQLISFFGAFLGDPRSVGAVIPSSRFLAQEMVSHIVPGATPILELGAGTGVVTRAMLNSGISPQQLIVVEQLPTLVMSLRHQFENVQIVQGDAAQLSSLLGNAHGQIQTVVSSLPLLSLSKDTANAILQEIDRHLCDGGRYIQYTYGLKPQHYDNTFLWKHLISKRIWLNVPPARVDVWEKCTPAKTLAT